MSTITNAEYLQRVSTGNAADRKLRGNAITPDQIAAGATFGTACHGLLSDSTAWSFDVDGQTWDATRVPLPSCALLPLP